MSNTNTASSILLILGAGDPEMQMIETVAVKAGVAVAYATVGGVRVHPGNAYKAEGYISADGRELPDCRVTSFVFVECDGESLRQAAAESPSGQWVVIDHHREGDPGFGKGPEEFLAGSSLGQMISFMAGLGHSWPDWNLGNGFGDDTRLPGEFAKQCQVRRNNDGSEITSCGHRVMDDIWTVRTVQNWTDTRQARVQTIPKELVLCAAADHCLEAAYRGLCPGINPDELMRWRAESRATFQKRPVEAVLADIEAARARLQRAVVCHRCANAGWESCGSPACYGEGEPYADLRGENIPELPEAAAREGIPFLAEVKDKDGRRKVVLQAAPPALVESFLRGEIVPGLKDMYGSPARGLAGGHL